MSEPAEGRKSVSTQEDLLTLGDQVTSGGNALTLPLRSPPPKHTPVPTSLITLAPPTCSPAHLLLIPRSASHHSPCFTPSSQTRVEEVLRPQTKREQHSPLGQKGETQPGCLPPPPPCLPPFKKPLSYMFDVRATVQCVIHGEQKAPYVCVCSLTGNVRQYS
ncbi:hypothetical protein NQZ68_040879 [Dissostichus eleginoides]|nr:hypothetical protein NQZ68_040879 [Dissostichus eleginoides]